MGAACGQAARRRDCAFCGEDVEVERSAVPGRSPEAEVVCRPASDGEGVLLVGRFLGSRR